ncbi:MAG: alpha/beta fold hydrolase [Acidobacteria bacterium]|uniref:Alpha/beta fold hydrolase n=1 Tax=Candidatus Polarisedimenticola svalbardensis TaxID=2886004 RepID=A0A8J6XZP4_9BACT|nr:alpha/beta fold hydrolase [Candidatus Polarisedimenticola svalbardensis]
MSLYLLIIPVLLLLWFVLDRLVSKHYRPKDTKHTFDPGKFGIPFETVRFDTADGGNLSGWWIPGKQDGPVLILVHGWENNAGRLIRFIREFHPLGYNLLAFDARSHGDSSFTAKTTVWSYTEDTLAAIRYVRERNGNDSRIGLVGFSIGGGAAINAAAHSAGIRTVLTVGAVAHPLEVMRLTFDRKGVPYIPLVWIFFRYLELRYNIRFNRIAPVRHIGKVPAPVFLIHGEDDRIVLPDQSRKLMDAGNQDLVRIWIAPGLAHGEWDNLPLFWERVLQYLDETIPVT